MPAPVAAGSLALWLIQLSSATTWGHILGESHDGRLSHRDSIGAGSTRRPGRKRELAVEADAVSDTAANNFLIPMKLSPAARTAGWTSLIQGPPERRGRRCWNPICGTISWGEQRLES